MRRRERTDLSGGVLLEDNIFLQSLVHWHRNGLALARARVIAISLDNVQYARLLTRARHQILIPRHRSRRIVHSLKRTAVDPSRPLPTTVTYAVAQLSHENSNEHSAIQPLACIGNFADVIEMLVCRDDVREESEIHASMV